MNTAPLRSSRLWIPTALFVLALAVAGVVWATTASAGLPGGERDRVARAATEAVGGGDDRRCDDHGSDGFASPGDDSRDADDRALSALERTSAENAARAALGGGTVTKVEAEDDGGEAYEVEVRRGDGTLWDVALDTDFDVLEKSLDD